MGFPGCSVVKKILLQYKRHRRHGLTPGLERSPGGGHDNPLQYSCLENPMDRGTWWATVHVVSKESDTAEQLILV